MTLGEALPLEMKRVREKVLPEYIKIGPPGAIAVALMQHDLTIAEKALAEGDVVTMLRVYESLKATSV